MSRQMNWHQLQRQWNTQGGRQRVARQPEEQRPVQAERPVAQQDDVFGVYPRVDPPVGVVQAANNVFARWGLEDATHNPFPPELRTQLIMGIHFTHQPEMNQWYGYYNGRVIRVSQEQIDDGVAYEYVGRFIGNIDREEQLRARTTTTGTPLNFQQYMQNTRQQPTGVNTVMHDEFEFEPVEERQTTPMTELIIETFNLLHKRFLITEEQYRGMTDLLSNPGNNMSSAVELLKMINKGEF